MSKLHTLPKSTHTHSIKRLRHRNLPRDVHCSLGHGLGERGEVCGEKNQELHELKDQTYVPFLLLHTWALSKSHEHACGKHAFAAT